MRGIEEFGLGEKRAAADQLKEQGASEDALARRFVGEYAQKLRFDHTRGKWMEFDGAIWREDRRRRAFDYARCAIRDAGAGSKFGKASVASGVEAFAKADPRMSACADDWDADPFLLGTPGAPIDLKTGNRLPPDSSYMLTRATSVTPQEGTPTLWLEFLHEATAGDAELIRFLQQIEQRLAAEHARILQWMIEGCLDWQAHGLVRPTSVTRQTEQYFADQDLMGQFIADRCELDPLLHEATGRLFAAYEKYSAWPWTRQTRQLR